MSRLIIRSVVVLPHPDGPMSTTIEPCSMSRSSAETASSAAPGNRLVTSRSRIAGVALEMVPPLCVVQVRMLAPAG